MALLLCTTIGETRWENPEAIRMLNHRRKLPENWRERVEKQARKVEDLKAKVREFSDPPTARAKKKLEKLRLKLWKEKLRLKLMRKTRNYNLSTSLNNYIDPRVYVRWAEEKKFDWRRIYPKSLQRRFEWCSS